MTGEGGALLVIVGILVFWFMFLDVVGALIMGAVVLVVLGHALATRDRLRL